MVSATDGRACPACDAALSQGLADWHFQCPGCGLETSTLAPHIQAQAEGGDMDEDAREHALRPLRDANFDRLLQWMDGRGELLEVGCAHGWFLEKAAKRYRTVGIEPDPNTAVRSLGRGLPVRAGFFPEVLAPAEIFDCIVFNDVLEHIPGVDAMLRQCAAHLRDSGTVVVNAPDSRGVIYRMSKVLFRLGMRGPFERMWQVGLPSPHLYYFNSEAIGRLARRTGFAPTRELVLASVHTQGLYDRIRYDRTTSVPFALVVTAAMTLLSPFLRVLPADIRVWELRRGHKIVD
jgi:SAM-dependent methyltransferase